MIISKDFKGYSFDRLELFQYRIEMLNKLHSFLTWITASKWLYVFFITLVILLVRVCSGEVLVIHHV